MKIRPVGAELLHADGRTDMTNIIVAFRNFENAPENHLVLCTETIAVCSQIHTYIVWAERRIAEC